MLGLWMLRSVSLLCLVSFSARRNHSRVQLGNLRMRQALGYIGELTTVQVKIFKQPMTPWPKIKELKQAGELVALQASNGYQAYNSAHNMEVLTRILGWSGEDADALCRAAHQAHYEKKPGVHAYLKLWVAIPGLRVIDMLILLAASLLTAENLRDKERWCKSLFISHRHRVIDSARCAGRQVLGPPLGVVVKGSLLDTGARLP